MTNEEQNDSTASLAPQADWFLQMFVGMVNRDENGIGITLNVGGTIVSGELIGGKAYHEGIAGEQTP